MHSKYLEHQAWAFLFKLCFLNWVNICVQFTPTLEPLLILLFTINSLIEVLITVEAPPPQWSSLSQLLIRIQWYYINSVCALDLDVHVVPQQDTHDHANLCLGKRKIGCQNFEVSAVSPPYFLFPVKLSNPTLFFTYDTWRITTLLHVLVYNALSNLHPYPSSPLYHYTQFLRPSRCKAPKRRSSDTPLSTYVKTYGIFQT